MRGFAAALRHLQNIRRAERAETLKNVFKNLNFGARRGRGRDEQQRELFRLAAPGWVAPRSSRVGRGRDEQRGGELFRHAAPG